MREGEGYTIDEALLASQLLAFCEGMLSRFVRSEFKYRPTDDFDAPLAAGRRHSCGSGNPGGISPPGLLTYTPNSSR
ncbi:Synthetically lethal with a defective Min system protein A [Raoultella planticola]|uniref:Synthetically lethal with a defective Min system protein A n=1 Tax=Raoultella planticola TaxID=575 RepID=A0A485B9G0_RAOPL|nr:Synthetically lethal with a defective Min system protein A [Raoultella planticola]